METNYRRGARVEHAAVGKLREAGWFAQRSPSSKGDADILAVRRMDEVVEKYGLGLVYCILVSCKRTITECYPEDWNRTYNAAISIGAIAVVAGRFPDKRGMRFMRMLGPKVEVGRLRREKIAARERSDWEECDRLESELERASSAQPWEPFEINED